MEPRTAAEAFSGKKRQKKGQKQRQQENANVAEATRIKVAQVLEEFQASKEQVYTFEANLTNRDRATVHILCRKMGMRSKSSGRGDQRRVSVYKTKKAVGMKVKENLTHFTFSEESKDVLQEIFMRYPPGGEMDHNMAGEHDEHTDKLRGKRDDIFCKPSMSRSEISKKMESLASRIEKSQNLRQI